MDYCLASYIRTCFTIMGSLLCFAMGWSQNYQGYTMNEVYPNQIFVADNPDENGPNNWVHIGNADIHTFRNTDIAILGNYLYITGTRDDFPDNIEISSLYKYDLTNPTLPAQHVLTYQNLNGDQGVYTPWHTPGLVLGFDGILYVLANGRTSTRPIIVAVDPSTESIINGFFGGDDYLTLEVDPSYPGYLQYLAHEDIAISPCTGEFYASLSIVDGSGGAGAMDYVVTIDMATGYVTPLFDVAANTDGLSFNESSGKLFSSNSRFIYEVDLTSGVLTQVDDLTAITGIGGLDLEGLDFEVPRPPVIIDDTLELYGAFGSVDLKSNDVDPGMVLDYDTLMFTNLPSNFSVSVDTATGEVTVHAPHTFDGTLTLTYTIDTTSSGCIPASTLEGDLVVSRDVSSLCAGSPTAPYCDWDEDGLINDVDFDDDNDGILDVDELVCGTTAFLDFDPYNGQAPAETVIANNNLGIGDAILSMSLRTYGTGIVTGNNISDTHFTGETGIRIRQDQTGSFANRIEVELTFSELVSELKFKVNDLDLGDYNIVNAYDESGNLIVLQSSNYNINNSAVVVYNGNNEFYGSGSSASNTHNGTVDFDLTGHRVKRIIFQYYDDNGSGSVTWAEFSGKTCNSDFDFDGLPDYLDPDSDNDGCPDALEGSAPNSQIGYGNLDADNQITGGIDGNGVPIIASGGQALGSSQNPSQQAEECSPCNPDNPDFTDNDGDGLGDLCDLDDDNDGLTDCVESADSVSDYFGWSLNSPPGNLEADQFWDEKLQTWALQDTGTMTVNNITYSATSTQLVLEEPFFDTFEEMYRADKYIEVRFTVSPALSSVRLLNARSAWFQPADNGDSYYSATFLGEQGSGTWISLSNNVFHTDTGSTYPIVDHMEQDEIWLRPGTTYVVRVYPYGSIDDSSKDFSIFDDFYFLLEACLSNDNDNDGTPDHFDTDSDNDGCTDANEAYGSPNADADANGHYGTGDPPPTNADGTVIGAAYTTPADDDTSGIPDYLETMSPTLETQPSDQKVQAGQTAIFSIVSTDVDNYQWQISTDGGITFSNLAEGGGYTGTQTENLSVGNVDVNMSGYFYRIRLSRSGYICFAEDSDFAALNVYVATVITNRKITHRVNKN